MLEIKREVIWFLLCKLQEQEKENFYPLDGTTSVQIEGILKM